MIMAGGATQRAAKRKSPVVTSLPNARFVTRADHDKLDARVALLEDAIGDISDIKEGVFKIARYIKVAIPSVISAAIAAGIVNGKLGAFLNALLTGVS